MFKRNGLILLGATVLATACTEKPVRIGVWTGPTGANLASMVESEINFSGGVADRRLDARVVSQRAVSFNELTPEKLRLSLDSMANDSTVRAVVMRMTDSVTEAAAQHFESIGMPYLITTPVSESYTRTHPHAFLLVPTVEEQAKFLVDQGMAEKAPRRVAIINVREPHADSLAAAITRELERRGVTPVFVTSFSQSADELNLQAKADETVTYKPTVLYFIARSPSLFVMHGWIRNKLPDVRLLGSDLIESFHLYANPGWKYTGLRFVRYLDPRSPDSLVVSLRDRLWGWVGRDELNSEAAVTYDAMKGVAQLMREGALTREALTQALRSGTPLQGLQGTWQFDGNQRVRRDMHLAEVKLDRIVDVATSKSQAVAQR